MKAKIIRPDFYEGDKVISMSATVKSGEVTKTKDFKFLVRKADRTEQQSLAEDIEYIKKNIPSIITENVIVMGKTVMPCGSNVVWKSSATAFLADSGTVIRPDFGMPSEEVTITATVTKGEINEEIIINTTVLSMTEEDELNIVSNKITWDLIKGDNIDKARVTANLVFPPTVDEIKITWKASDPRFVDSAGTVTRPEYTETDAQITVYAVLTKGEKSLEKSITGIKILKKSPSSQQRCDDYVNDKANLVKWVTADGTNGNTDIQSIVEGFILPAEKEDLLLTWTVVNSAGENTTTSYFNIEYIDDSEAQAEAARRYLATVNRPDSTNVQTYIKVVASISETNVDDVLVPGGSANKVYPVTILKANE